MYIRPRKSPDIVVKAWLYRAYISLKKYKFPLKMNIHTAITSHIPQGQDR